MHITLYGNKISGHSYKVALFLRLAKIDYAYEEIDIFIEHRDRPIDFIEVAKFSEVPVLLYGNRALTQSNAILLWLANHFRKFTSDSGDIFDIYQWLFWEMSRLSLGVANLRYLSLYQNDVSDELITHYKKRSEDALLVLDNELSSKDFLCSDTLTIADISCCGYLFWQNEMPISFEKYRHVCKWLDRISNYPEWLPPNMLLGSN